MFSFPSFSPKKDFTAHVEEVRNKSAQLVDIREKNEWERGRFACAVNIPLSEIHQGPGIEKLKTYDKVMLHCRSGHRVRIAERILSEMGLDNFEIIDIGMPQMAKLGFEFQA